MSAIPLSTLATSRRWQTNFLKVLLAVQEHAAIQFRRLRPEARAEATAQAIASACVSYRTVTRQHKLSRVYAGNIATFAVRAVNGGRHVGGHINSKDVLSPLAQKRRGFATTSINPWNRQEGDWRDMVLETRRATPADQAAFNLDFQTWLNGWSRRHRQIIFHLAAGHRTNAMARKFGVSEARISQLRREYQESWELFQGMAAVSKAA